MRTIYLLAIISLCSISSVYAQKVKTTSLPVGWTYFLQPTQPLDPAIKKNEVIVKTNMNSLSSDDYRELDMRVTGKSYDAKKAFYAEAHQDTLKKWASDYVAITTYPIIESSEQPDLQITLTANNYKVENVQLDIDFDDPESIICEVVSTARLTVTTSGGDILLDEEMNYVIDEEEENNYLLLSYFMLNPVFKTRLKVTKNPEKRTKILQNKIDRFEAEVLEYFFKESRNIMKNNFIGDYYKASASFYTIKDKAYTAANEATESARAAILSLSALSKKKRKTIDEVQPDLEAAIATLESAVSQSDNVEVQKYLKTNIAICTLVLGNGDSASTQLESITEYQELDKGLHVMPSFKGYLMELDKALAVKKNYKDRAVIREL